MRTSSRAPSGSAPSGADRSRGSHSFIRQVVNELKKVVTPTRRELFSYTGVVLVFVIIMMALVYGLDYGFGWLVTWVFGNGTARPPDVTDAFRMERTTVTEDERRDIDLAPAAEQSSETDDRCRTTC